MIECAYGLRYVERTNSSDPADLWRVRQVAVYQKFAGSEAPETWIFISASQTMMKTVKKYLHNNLSPRLRSPFELHLAIITVALANWRWYIKSLVEQTEEQVSQPLNRALRVKTLTSTRRVELLAQTWPRDPLRVSWTVG
jgi:hypothetical protein